MKKILTLLVTLGLVSSAFAADFTSFQLASTTLTNGYILQTNGKNNKWVATSSLGFSTGGSGTVTSVSALTPTGLTVSSTTCTTNCILNFTLTSGYVIPLSASTTQWNTFYNASNTLVTFNYASSTFPSFTYSSSTNPSFGYGSSTYYFASNPSGYITSSALSPYVLLSYASSTFLSFVYGSSTYVAVTGNQTIGGNKSFTGTTNLTNWTGSNGTSSVLDVTSVFHLNGATLVDSNNASGTLGQLLQSTGTSTRWVSTSTLGISGALSGGTTGWLPYWTSASTLSAFSTGTPGQLLSASSTSSSGFAWVSTSSLGITGGSATPGGSDTQIQFNDGGSFGGYSGLTYNKTTNRLTISNPTASISPGIYFDVSDGTGYNIETSDQTATDIDGDLIRFSAGNGNGIGTGGSFIMLAGDGDELGNGNGGEFYLTGGTGSGTSTFGGGFALYGGNGGMLGQGGEVTIRSGGSNNNTGALVQIIAGNVNGTGAGGGATFSAGNGGDTGGAGGNVSITAGYAQAGDSNGGDVNLVAGNKSGSGLIGHVNITDPNSGYKSIFDTSLLTTTNKTFTFPDEGGTFTLGTGSAGNCAQWSATNTLADTGSPCGGGGLSGGQNGYLTRWLSPTTVGTSTVLDDGVVAGVNATSSLYEFYVKGDTIGSHSPFAVASTSGNNIFSVESNGRVVINQGLADSTNATGTLGQVLLSTGTSTLWVSTSSLGIAGAGSITGSGTNGYATRWTSSSNLGSGKIIDDGTSIGVNATSSTVTVNIQANGGTSPLTISSSSGATLASFAANGSLLIGTSTISATSAPSFGVSLEASNITGALDFIKARTKSLRNFMIGNDHWAANKVWYSPGIANAGLWQNTVGANLGTAALVSPTVTANSYTALRRTTFASVVAPNNQQVGTRTAAEFFRGSGSTVIPEVNNRIGGFFYYAKFGFTTWTNGNDLFVGLSSCTTACVTGTTTLTNLTNTVGIGVERGNNNLVFLTNDASGVISTTTLATAPATNQYFDFYMYQAPNDSVIYYRLDNASTSAIIATGSVNTNLPATTTLMTAQAVMGNGLNATVGSATLGISRIYLETEK